mmetsp:Transcript_7799/g.18849  ORF Transcript_7799/g.18849 Transcript_7799/m.18849 type:complete len:207 (-) Transcript_7799:1068-1688(-)
MMLLTPSTSPLRFPFLFGRFSFAIAYNELLNSRPTPMGSEGGKKKSSVSSFIAPQRSLVRSSPPPADFCEPLDFFSFEPLPKPVKGFTVSDFPMPIALRSSSLSGAFSETVREKPETGFPVFPPGVTCPDESTFVFWPTIVTVAGSPSSSVAARPSFFRGRSRLRLSSMEETSDSKPSSAPPAALARGRLEDEAPGAWLRRRMRNQ